jgi:hypothetical protein
MESKNKVPGAVERNLGTIDLDNCNTRCTLYHISVIENDYPEDYIEVRCIMNHVLGRAAGGSIELAISKSKRNSHHD